ncbi:hypothetical protein [Trinickia dabaoshanensis]|uniref:hypothetical protein n=1 Tax=Trinickia dabaoshanensis TaxID=564714 RepID=UPI001E43FABD|nr:hypothetical protein [Trinickia dabaoshanensis]
MPGVAAAGAAGAGAAAAEDPDGDAAAPARVPADEPPSPPPQPASAMAAANEMQFNFVLNGKRIFNPLMGMFRSLAGRTSFKAISKKGKAMLLRAIKACEIVECVIRARYFSGYDKHDAG